MSKIVYRITQSGLVKRVDLDPPRERNLSWIKALWDVLLMFAVGIITALVVMALYNIVVEFIVTLTTFFPGG
jgi:hypothetical protein